MWGRGLAVEALDVCTTQSEAHGYGGDRGFKLNFYLKVLPSLEGQAKGLNPLLKTLQMRTEQAYCEIDMLKTAFQVVPLNVLL